MPIQKRGRKRKEEKGLKRFKSCNFTIDPLTAEKLDLIQHERSPFFDAVLSKVPSTWVDDYNQDPKSFLDEFKKKKKLKAI